MNSNRDITDSDASKLADIFNTISARVSIDDELIDARAHLRNFNEYLFDERNAEHHIDICDALDSGEDVLGIIPRNSGKSTIVTTRYPAYSLGEDRGQRIIIGSHTASLSQSFTRSIEAILRLDKFKIMYGDMVPSASQTNLKWNETEKMVKDRPDRNKLGYRVDAKDASLFAVGVGGAVVGRRADKIILDDIIDRNSVKTEAQLADTKYWFNEELKGCRHAHTQTIVVGSRWNSRDIYISIMSVMQENDAEISGNMIEEVQEQIKRLRELEQEVNVDIL